MPEDLIVSVARLARRHHGPRLNRAGIHPRKTHAIRRHSDALALSVISAGRGWCNGAAVQAPCILVHHAGQPQLLRPDPRWSECFIVFDGPLEPVLAAAGIVALPDVVPIAQAVADALVELLGALLPQVKSPGVIDLLDASAIGWVVLAAAAGAADDRPDSLLQAESWLVRHLDARIDFRKLARWCGVSSSTVRRHWLDAHGVPPAVWLTTRRLEFAQQLLAQTTLLISEVARRSGWADQRRFATVFRQHAGVTPSIWRQRQRAPGGRDAPE